MMDFIFWYMAINGGISYLLLVIYDKRPPAHLPHMKARRIRIALHPYKSALSMMLITAPIIVMALFVRLEE